jgi:hypothetical protein
MQKADNIMKIYLENPDSHEVLEFLSLAVTHYEVLNAMAKSVRNKQFATKVKSILAEERKHLLLCAHLAKKSAIAPSQ